MTLLYSTTSPYVRKIRVLAHELGLADSMTLVAATVSPVVLDPTVASCNPLAKVPTLVLDDGMQLYDSRVISEYLLSLKPDGSALLPASGSARWTILRRQALCDGILDAAVLTRYEESLRPAALRWPDWQDGQEAKIRRGIAQLETEAAELGTAVRLDTIAAGCVCGYLDLRFTRLAWRDQAPRLAAFNAVFAERASMIATRP